MSIYAGILGFTWSALTLIGVFAWRWPLRWAFLFAAIQTAAGLPWSPLVLMGVPICLVLALTGSDRPERSPVTGKTIWVWPRWAWLWSNDEDGVSPVGYQTPWDVFVWTGLRNTVSNFRFVPGVSGHGRPFWYWTGRIAGRQIYAKSGWEAGSGWPSMSAGSGRGW